MFSGNFVLMVLVIGVLIGLLLKQIIVGFAYGITCLLCGFPTKRAADEVPHCTCKAGTGGHASWCELEKYLAALRR